MKRIVSGFFSKSPFLKSILIIKMTVLFLVAFVFQAQASGPKISISKKNVPLREIFNAIEKESNYLFMYESGLVNTDMKATVVFSNAEIEKILDACLKKAPLMYTIVGNSILIKKKPLGIQTNYQVVQEKEISVNRTLTGLVTDTEKKPLEGASVFVKFNEKIGTSTNKDGKFSIYVPTDAKILVVNFVGYKSEEILIGTKSDFIVRLQPEVKKIDDVIITGIYSRTKESFTGSATTYSAKEIKSVGNTNIIQSLKTLDPVFAVLENNQFGSDPNSLPDLEIRGKSSMVGLKEEFGVDPNQPLFILDGFETSLRTIMDFDMERVESITILKDAASTAIYGSKAANGVIVIETKQPLPGQLRVSYNSNLTISMADFSSYNLMNASEKLEFELLAGRYSLETWDLYNKRLAEVTSGVNTYWLAERVRTGVNQRQSIYAEGGDAAMRYGVGANYNTIAGVMKNSSRTILSGNVDLIYRKNKFLFSNKLTLDQVNASNPTVSFSEYSRANPYYRKRTEDGFINKWLENTTEDHVRNPLWNDHLNSRSLEKGGGITNNFSAEYSPFSALKFRARMGLTKKSQQADQFLSPEHTSFDAADPLLKGRLTYGNMEQTQMEGEFTTTYGVVLQNKHRINAVGGARVYSLESVTNGYTAEGFPVGNYVTPSFAKGFPENGKPDYSESISRSTSVYANAGYSYDERFLMDFTYRLSGASVFGSNKQFANTWATGLAWNLHNESLIQNVLPWVNLLKIRASVGNPGNQNFSAFQTFSTYGFSNRSNYFAQGVYLNTLGNPDLKWQTTLDKNIGVDASFLNRKLSFNLDYFDKLTDPLLINVGVPSSLGINTVLTNLGKQAASGFNGTITYSPIYRPAERTIWSLRYNFRTEISRIDNIGNALDKFNESGRNSNLNRYYDGANPDALWAVISAGVDPASGQEIYIKKDGIYSVDFTYEDEVQVGIARPKIEGIFGTSILIKGFSANVDFRYRYGGQAFNYALYNKVENISSSSIRTNQDKRALYDRWQRPGDISEFIGISLSRSTPMSSRFVEDDNSIELESVRVGYEFNTSRMQRSPFKSLRLNAYMNNVFRIGTIKTERGLDYPFARSVSLSLSTSF